MIRRTHKIFTRAGWSLGLAAVLLCFVAVPSAPAVQFSVELERDAAVVSRSDERVDYTARVKNVDEGRPQVGSVLKCVGPHPEKTWFPNPNTAQGKPELWPTFDFEWARGGEPIPGAEAQSYTVIPADEGEAIQCLITGTNSVAAGVYASLPAQVVDPQPATAPPAPSDRTDKASRPWVTDATGGFESAEKDPIAVKRFCKTDSMNWTGVTEFTSYQWLRNAVPIPGATTAEYQPVAADEGKNLQCEVVGVNAGGSVLGISDYNQVGNLENRVPWNNTANALEVIINPSDEESTLEIELPGGEETYAYKTEGSGWACSKEPASGAVHAKAICTRSDALAAGASYPPLTVVTALGADAPDVAIAKATASGGGSPPVSDEDQFTFAPPYPYGLEAFESGVLDSDGEEYTDAGGHPHLGFAVLEFAKKRLLVPENSFETAKYTPVEHIKQIITDLPRGFVGNALAVPELCSGVDAAVALECPPGSEVGRINIVVSEAEGVVPLYAIEPEFGTPAQFAFPDPLGNGYTLSSRLRPEEGYAISLDLAPAPKVALLGSTAQICNFGVDNSLGELSCKKASDPDANPVPLFTNPTRCEGPAPVTRARLNTWEHPDTFKKTEFTNAQITDCDEVKFEPEMELKPTSHNADSPTGLDVELTMDTDDLEKRDGISQANMKSARVTFPEGMALNASAGQGLGACTAAQVKLKTNLPIECPESSKIGTVKIETPLIKEALEGHVYVAKQGAVEGALIGLYMVFDSEKDGILIKIPGKVVFSPATGQLTTVIDQLPEAPFSSVEIKFAQGPRSPLITPPKCGNYKIVAKLAPWNAKDPDHPSAVETVTQTSSFQVNRGPGGGPCPKGNLEAKLSAGTEDPTAGKTSPFVLNLSRPDGSRRFTALNVTPPPGLTAYLKGIPYCPDAVLAGISGAPGTGGAEIEHPACPAASQIGTATAGAGAGSNPLFVKTGKVYLAGPYKGAPASLALVAPAIAGPLDLGNVVVRTATHINPETAQITAVSDPIPTILHGLLLDIRDVRVTLNRAHFTLNPTNCEPMSLGAEVKGEGGAAVSLNRPFQASGCERLGFKPKLFTRLFGGTHRGAHPSLRSVLIPAPGDANIARAAVTIPRSEFLDQAHIRTICTRVQFAADACPKGSIYGYAQAFTPLLDYPVEGPVYLRSSSNKLPDLVVHLKGPAHQPIEAVVVGHIDSAKGQINTTFESAPDVPVSKFVLKLQGGKKGLLVNSRDICAREYRATVSLEAQNNMIFGSRPLLKNSKCTQSKQGRKAQGKKHR